MIVAHAGGAADHQGDIAEYRGAAAPDPPGAPFSPTATGIPLKDPRPSWASSWQLLRHTGNLVAPAENARAILPGRSFRHLMAHQRIVSLFWERQLLDMSWRGAKGPHSYRQPFLVIKQRISSHNASSPAHRLIYRAAFRAPYL